MENNTHDNTQVLLVDDDSIILDSLSEFLQLEGLDVVTAQSHADALEVLARQTIDLVITDINMPGGNGFELLHVVKRKYPETVVIMLTGYGTIESAVEAIKLGAYDYLTKPVVDEDLKLCLERAAAQQAILRENQSLKNRLDERFALDSIIGRDFRMVRIFELVESVADSKVSILLQGPSGTGKSLMARVIHQQSDRRDKPFIEVSCGALPENLLESELFGHSRGAFTGAVANKIGKFKAAHGGTIFLDEIATATPAMQVKLLRVLQSQQFEPVGSNKTETVDIRVILATNVDLEQAVHDGTFREDLFYRINIVTLDLPTLAERIADIPMLADHFLKKSAAEMGRQILGFDEDAMQVMQRYGWPGNVRELENVIARAVVLCRGRHISEDDLPVKLIESSDVPDAAGNYIPTPLKQALEIPEKRILEAALRANDWNRQLTADQLDINRTTLYKKMKRFGLDPEHIGTP